MVKYDDEIRSAAEKVRPFGESWVDKLGDAFLSLKEDRKYLPNIVSRLIEDAKQEAEQRWKDRFRYMADGDLCTEESLNILREIQSEGYTLNVEKNKSIKAAKGSQAWYFRSNSNIQWFGQILLSPSKDLVAGYKQAAREAAERFAQTMYVTDAHNLVGKLGGMITYESGIVVVDVLGERRRFDRDYDMSQWLISTIVPKVRSPN